MPSFLQVNCHTIITVLPVECFGVKLQSVEPVDGAFHKSSVHDGFVVIALYMLYITEISMHGVV